MPDANLAVHQAKVFFGPKHARIAALDDVTLAFHPGELTVVMGPSGSGKTTLLSLLGCLRKPDQGSVLVEGREVAGLQEKARAVTRSRIGFVFQAFRLFHSLPALENVMIAAEVSTGGRDRLSAAQQLLVRLGLKDKMHLKPDALSGGEKQRVAIARALLIDPPIVLADEPTASLDHASGQTIREILQKTAKEQQRTVVVVSHDARWISHANRVVRLEDGRVTDDRRQTPC